MARPAVDRTGRVYGLLTVVRRAGSIAGGNALWRCRCACGRLVDRSSAVLKPRVASDCGDARAHPRAHEDLTGRVCGVLTVLGPAGRRGRELTWTCRCARCGRTTVLRRHHVLSRRRACRHCAGTARGELWPGRRFGRLVVVARVPRVERSYAVLWRCRCDCGRTHVVAGIHLRAGHVRSCGCLGRGPAPGGGPRS